ncbi:hypothetical protein V497_07119 [Pseudogymnoascus sp. VKM F-4516 (FW-969)]|nr:hypothetical protein V497_07119 [Pseudogymnoascus sp. VKM F-4516 (FW-969)]
MKSIALLALAGAASAHYTFPALISGGTTTGAWEYVRDWTGSYTYNPVQDVSSLDIRCNVDGSTNTASTLDVTAGSKIGFSATPDIYHPGPVLAYLAKVPSGQTAATWDGSGSVWFKIYEDGPTGLGTQLAWPSDAATSVSFTIPSATPDGEYLVRVEHIALHSASASGGAQFYISCGQINVTGGGSGTPGPLVAFPGAYSASDPGILIGIYYPVWGERRIFRPELGDARRRAAGHGESSTHNPPTLRLYGRLRAYMLQTNKTSSKASFTPNLPGMHESQLCIRCGISRASSTLQPRAQTNPVNYNNMRSAILIVSALFSLAAGAAIDSDVLTKHENVGRATCSWIGHAPMCKPGNCPAGTQACAQDFCGDGACCFTGFKVKCCTVNPNVPSCT